MSKNVKIVVVLALIVLGIVVLYIMFRFALIIEAFRYAVNNIVNVTGMSSWLAQAIVFAVLLPFLWAIRYAFAPFSKYKWLARGVVVGYLVVFSLTMYFASREAYFGFREGEVLKWYAVTPEGVRFFDAPGVDPKYGIKLKPVTPEVISSLEKMKRGMQPKRLSYASIDEVEFFNSITGESKVWYHQAPDGNYELFDSEGVHPSAGEPLKPVTKEVFSRIKERAQVLAVIKTEEELKAKQQLEAKQKEEYINRYLVATLVNKPDVQDIAVFVLDESGTPNFDVSKKIATQLGAKKYNATASLVKDSFVTDGLFEKVSKGDVESVRRLDLSRFTDYLALGRHKITFSENPELQGMITARATLEIRIVSAKSGSIEDSFTIAEMGAGFSKKAAEVQSMERILIKIGEKLWKF